MNPTSYTPVLVQPDNTPVDKPQLIVSNDNEARRVSMMNRISGVVDRIADSSKNNPTIVDMDAEAERKKSIISRPELRANTARAQDDVSFAAQDAQASIEQATENVVGLQVAGTEQEWNTDQRPLAAIHSEDILPQQDVPQPLYDKLAKLMFVALQEASVQATHLYHYAVQFGWTAYKSLRAELQLAMDQADNKLAPDQHPTWWGSFMPAKEYRDKWATYMLEGVLLLVAVAIGRRVFLRFIGFGGIQRLSMMSKAQLAVLLGAIRGAVFESWGQIIGSSASMRVKASEIIEKSKDIPDAVIDNLERSGMFPEAVLPKKKSSFSASLLKGVAVVAFPKAAMAFQAAKFLKNQIVPKKTFTQKVAAKTAAVIPAGAKSAAKKLPSAATAIGAAKLLKQKVIPEPTMTEKVAANVSAMNDKLPTVLQTKVLHQPTMTEKLAAGVSSAASSTGATLKQAAFAVEDKLPAMMKSKPVQQPSMTEKLMAGVSSSAASTTASLKKAAIAAEEMLPASMHVAPLT
jgi:hypothetical protein